MGDLSSSPFPVWAFHPPPSHREKAQGLTNISSLPAGDGASLLQNRGEGLQTAQGAGEMQGQGLFCEDQGTPWLWGWPGCMQGSK